ncbi:hypothetical protein E2C01_048238 [Portunus trituberculatus]|uniref:Uncharacterized protein n=1 Tax=Portunus trituberculatus TaxID=210409 RepID=A0A5B7G9N8_PORTR|nr:hypothetical protein [Portunus trituberculatus]
MTDAGLLSLPSTLAARRWRVLGRLLAFLCLASLYPTAERRAGERRAEGGNEGERVKCSRRVSSIKVWPPPVGRPGSPAYVRHGGFLGPLFLPLLLTVLRLAVPCTSPPQRPPLRPLQCLPGAPNATPTRSLRHFHADAFASITLLR